MEFICFRVHLCTFLVFLHLCPMVWMAVGREMVTRVSGAIAIDTDVGPDDVAAINIMFSYDVPVLQITTVAGMSRAYPAAIAIIRMMQQIGMETTMARDPIAGMGTGMGMGMGKHVIVGAEKPLDGSMQRYPTGLYRDISESMPTKFHWPQAESKPIQGDGFNAAAKAIASMHSHMNSNVYLHLHHHSYTLVHKGSIQQH